MEHQNQYPVVSVSLKEMYGKTFAESLAKYAEILSALVKDHEELYDSDLLSEYFQRKIGKYEAMTASEIELDSSLFHMTMSLNDIYDRKVMVIVEEYDVPLYSAWKNGYLKEMKDFLSSLFSSVFKSNNYLYRGVLIGTLGLPRAGVISGFNNYYPNTISDGWTAKDFGFTQGEVDGLLQYYHLEKHSEEVRKWYGGYRFGRTDIYNPSSVLHFVHDAINNPDAKLSIYLADTEVQQVIYHYIDKHYGLFMYDLRTLLEGQSIEKSTWFALPYGEIEEPGNIYTYLLYNGYLRRIRYIEDQPFVDEEMAITNQEVLSVYLKLIEKCAEDHRKRNHGAFIEGLIKGDEFKIRRMIRRALYYLDYLNVSYDVSLYHKLMCDLLLGDDVTLIKDERHRHSFYMTIKTESDQNIILGYHVAETRDELHQVAQKAFEKLPFNSISYGIAFYRDNYDIVSSQELTINATKKSK